MPDQKGVTIKGDGVLNNGRGGLSGAAIVMIIAIAAATVVILFIVAFGAYQRERERGEPDGDQGMVAAGLAGIS